MPEVVRGDTKKFQVTIRDTDGNLVDPDSIALTLIKEEASDSPVGPLAGEKASMGVWFVVMTIPNGLTLGDWVRDWVWYIAGRPNRYQSLVKVNDLTERVLSFE